MRIQRTDRGFSLVEMVIVIAIFAVVASIAMTAMSQWVPSRRLKAATRDIASALAQAKAEAIRRGERVALVLPDPDDFELGDALFVMCVDNGKGPRDAKGNAEDLADADENGICDPGEQRLLASDAIPVRVTLSAQTKDGREARFRAQGKTNSVVFGPRGMPVKAETADDSVTSGQIRLCLSKGGKTVQGGAPCRLVTVQPSGRIIVAFD